MGSSVILPVAGQPKTGADPGFTSGSVPNLVSFGFQGVSPPSTLYMQRDDVLILEGTAYAGDTITLNARVLLPYATNPGQPDVAKAGGVVVQAPALGPGYIQVIQKQFVITGTLSAAQVVVAGLEGYLLSVVVTGTLSLRRGDTFVRVWLNRGPVLIASPNAFALLLADYVTVNAPVGWPGGRILSPADGAGKIVRYAPVNPALGADFSVALNAPGRTRLQTVKATLATSGVAGNRFPSFSVSHGTAPAVVYQAQDTTAVPASTTITYSLGPGATFVRGGGAPIFATMPMPSPLMMDVSVVVASSTQGLLAGDQWSGIILDTEEWLDSF